MQMCLLNIGEEGGEIETGMAWEQHKTQQHNFCVCLGTENTPEEMSLQKPTIESSLLSFASFAVPFFLYK